MSRGVLPSIATAAAVVVDVLAALRLAPRPPTAGEAYFAAAVFASRNDRLGAVSLPLSDLVAARQFAAVAALVPGGAGSVWDVVRSAGLVLGVVSAVLLWPVVRRLGCGGVPTALSVAVAGVTPVALTLHASATAAAVAVPWLLLAASLGWRGRVLGLGAVSAAVVAVMTAPLLGGALLALAAHAVVDRTVSGTVPPARGAALAGGLGLGAAVTAVAASGRGPLAGVAAPPIATAPVLVGVGGGLVLVTVAWRTRWVRPLLTPALLLLAGTLPPGPGRAAAALCALALLAVILAAVADDVTARLPDRAQHVLGAGVAAALAVSVVMPVVGALTAVPVPSPRAEPVPAPLLSWAEEGAATAVVHADPLARAELIVGGFPEERLRPIGGPVAADDLLLLAGRPQDPGSAEPAGCPAGTLVADLRNWRGAPTRICAGRPVTDDPVQRASRNRFGTALVRNPALRLDPAAVDLLRRGDVDPRIMVVLAALTGTYDLAVTGFPAAAFEPPTALRRQVLLRSVDGASATTNTPPSLRAWLERQDPPYRPTAVREDPGGLLVGYGGPAPPGLLPG